MLKIGDFSKLARVTVKAIRHYDKIGLLRPVHVDSRAGYRYYAPEQLLSLNRIILLKDLGFGLADIRRLLREPRRMDEAIELRRRELEAEISNSHEKLRRLDAFRRARDFTPDPTPVLVTDIPTVLALVAREVVQSGGSRVGELFEDLEARAAHARARADVSPFLLFHGPPDGDQLDVEVCIPIKRGAGTLTGTRIVSGCPKAGSILYRGPYSHTRPHLLSLRQWIKENGGRSAGPMREVYHRFGADQRGYSLPSKVLAARSDDYLTELQAPISAGSVL